MDAAMMASWHGKHLPERYQATPGKLLRLRIESIVNSVGLRIVTRTASDDCGLDRY